VRLQHWPKKGTEKSTDWVIRNEIRSAAYLLFWLFRS
jgi:hypothetical protein